MRSMPFTGVEWTFQARDLGFMEEIESDEEISPSKSEELEMPELPTSKTVTKIVHHYDDEEANSLDSVMDNS